MWDNRELIELYGMASREHSEQTRHRSSAPTPHTHRPPLYPSDHRHINWDCTEARMGRTPSPPCQAEPSSHPSLRQSAASAGSACSATPGTDVSPTTDKYPRSFYQDEGVRSDADLHTSTPYSLWLWMVEGKNSRSPSSRALLKLSDSFAMISSGVLGILLVVRVCLSERLGGYVENSREAI